MSKKTNNDIIYTEVIYYLLDKKKGKGRIYFT